MAPSVAEIEYPTQIDLITKSPRKSFDLFPKSRVRFSESLFENPTSEYRGTPLWSWNTKLNLDQLYRQIDDLQNMGLGGFHMHSRVGLDTEYLGPEYMNTVKRCVERAKEKGMLAWLYDEDRWPSGAAGGLVTKDEDCFRSRHMLITPWKYGDSNRPAQEEENHSCSAVASRSELGYLVARYHILLDDDGFLTSSRRLKDDEENDDNTWFAYVETNPPSEWFNGSYYVDTLSKRAMQRFVDITYETYKKAVGLEFGKTVPAIFTDEPQFALKNQLRTAHGRRDIFLPWTLDLQDSYEKAYNADIMDTLPEVVWNIRGVSKTRYNYHDHVCARFVSAFVDLLGDWCNQNGIALTGHMMKEPTLRSQTSSLGEAMRCYRNMALPGIDMLCDRKEYTTAKQAQSVSRQYGRCGVLSEIYGVTNWTFTFEGHKGSGDWQAALGVNVRAHHLSWVTMAGEAKRDYPAAIGYQSPWYKEYPLVENHFARVNTALSRGKALVRVTVVHPIESFWLCFGPNETSTEQDERDRQFLDLTNWLCHGLVDFDFISESLLPDQRPHTENQKFKVGVQEYDVVLVPNLKTIRSTTLEQLEMFAGAGGRIIVAGSDASLVDVEASTRPQRLPAKRIPFSKFDILKELEDLQDMRVVLDTGAPADSLLYQMRADGEDRYVFVCNSDRTQPKQGRVQIRGNWSATLLDTMTGKLHVFHTQRTRGWTTFNHRFEGCGSLLLRLSPIRTTGPLAELVIPDWKVSYELTDCVTSLSEPNVFLLDIASHRIDQEEVWYPPEEVLRIDNIARERLGMPLKKDAFAQPWTKLKTQPIHTISLRYSFTSTIDVAFPKLALESASSTTVTLNGERACGDIDGYWVDESISTIPLPSISKGENTLEVTLPFSESTNLERIYILGRFGVDLRGRKARIVPLHLENLTIGDYTSQGFPFYAGNMDYDFDLIVPEATTTVTNGSVSNGHAIERPRHRVGIQVPRFSAPLLAVYLNEVKVGAIAFQPHTLDLGHLEPGTYKLRITSFGNRDHAFGAIHLPDGLTKWYGPDAWRTSGDWWSYEYTIREMGLLSAVRVLTTDEKVAAAGIWDRGSVKGYL